MATYSQIFDSSTDTFSDDWTSVDGYWSIDSDQLWFNGSGGTWPSWVDYNSALDTQWHYCEIKCVSVALTAGFMSPIVNAVPGEKTGYASLTRQSSSISRLTKYVDGESSTTLASTGEGEGPPIVNRLERDGAFLRLYKDGVEIAEYEILGTPLSGTGVAIKGHSNTGSRGEDFFAGDISQSAGAPTLSLPNVTSITANSAVPNVTLTF